MVKGNNNLKNKSHQSSKPYDVSNSFVRKITSRVSELLPQSTWLNRWLSPAEVPVTSSILNSQQHLSRIVTSHIDIPHASTSRSDLNAVEDSIDHYRPSKRPRIPFKSQFQPSSFISSNSLDSRKEEISPIAAQSELRSISSRGLGSLHKQGSSDFVSSTPAVEGSVSLCDKLNGDDCSETSESTSGCSSLVPQAQSAAVGRKITSKDLNASTQTQSTSLPRRTTKVDLSVLQRRRPVFNTTTFASPGRFRDQASSSPFYVGRTMYGGAASNSTLNTSITSRHVGPKIQPANCCSQNVPLSSTAKRILDALEQFSTPVLDAKLNIGSKRKFESNTQRYAELSIPTTPDLLRVKRRERLLNSTRAARQTSVTASSEHHYNTPEDVDNEYKLRKHDNESNKYAGKVRVRGRGIPVEEQPEEVRLPQIKLTLNNLPAIDISVPPPLPTLPPAPPPRAVTIKQPFVFAAPVMIKSQSHASDVISTFDFQFSSPLCVTRSEKSDSDLNSKKSFNLSVVPTKTFSEEKNQTKKPVIKDSDKIVSDNKLVQLNTTSEANTLDSKGKVLENIPKENGVNSAGTVQSTCTECSASCTLGNSKCDACKKELVKKKVYTSETISSKTGTSSTDSWKCKQCNDSTVKGQDVICSDCQTSKKSVQPGFGDKFKPPSGSWKCQTCCIYNGKDVFECIACGTKKVLDKPDEKFENKNHVPTTGFGNMFKQSAGSWSCKECWSQNPSTSLKCAACETPKPGSFESGSKQKTPPKVTFGSTNNSSGFVFGIDKAGDTVKCSQNDSVSELSCNTTNKVQSVINDSGKGNGSFQFGMPKSVSGTTELNFTFGVPVKNTHLPSAQENKESGGNAVDTAKQSIDTECKNKLKDSVQNELANSSQIDKDVTKKETLKNSSNIVVGSVTNPPAYKSQDTTIPNVSGTVSKLPVSSPAGFTFGSIKPPTNVGSENNSSATNSTKLVFGSAVSAPGSFHSSTNESTIPNIFSSGETPTTTFKFEPTKTVSSTDSVVTSTLVLTAKPSTTASINSGIKGNTPHTFGTVINREEKNNFFSNEVKVPSFGSTGSTTTFGDVCKDNTPNNLELKQTFGNPANKELSANIFGSQTTPKNHVFGQPPTSATAVPSFNLFGSTNTFQNTNSFPNIEPVQENKSSTVFTFGTPTNKEEEPAQGGFAFSPVVEKPQTFGFTAQGNTNNNGFAFNTVGTPSSTFSFTPKTENKTNLFNTSVPTFGAVQPNSTPAFGIPQATPAFGESVVTPSPVFTFGATQPQQQPTPGAFAFSASQNTCGSAPATGTPNFVFGSSATASSTPTPTFDPNVKPTFNFTGGATPSFTATDGAPRKFRKAVRRQTQR